MVKKTIAIFYLSLLLVSAVFTQNTAKAPKLTAEEILAKHLASIGTPEAISAAKSRVFVGTTELYSKLVAIPEQQRTGQCQIAFDGDKYVYAAVFLITNYPYEKVAYDGKDLSYGNNQYGRARLSGFLTANRFISKRAMLGGALNAGWLLANPEKGVSFEYDGQSKDEGYYKVKVNLSDSEGTIVTLFFDPATFHHVRTEYKWSKSGLMTRSPSASTAGPTTLSSERGASPTHQVLNEYFSNFSKAGELVLPLTYKIELETPSNTWSWTNSIKDVYFNETLEASIFKIS
jgi:hypothetical protein